MRDPFITEVRRIRAKLAKEREKDPEGFRARLKAIEEVNKHRLVRLEPRRIKPVK